MVNINLNSYLSLSIHNAQFKKTIESLRWITQCNTFKKKKKDIVLNYRTC